MRTFNVYLHRHPRITFCLKANTWQEEMQTSPEPGRRPRTIKAVLSGWLIKMGLIPPPDELNDSEKQLTEEQRKAQLDLRFHQIRKPRYW